MKPKGHTAFSWSKYGSCYQIPKGHTVYSWGYLKDEITDQALVSNNCKRKSVCFAEKICTIKYFHVEESNPLMDVIGLDKENFDKFMRISLLKLKGNL